MLDRTRFAAYIMFGVVFAGFIYPTVAHWTWGGGWLAQDGFLDFAGSSIVHLQGALAALAGTLLLGARIGKFRNGKAVPIPGHSIPLAILGVLILWVGWMGFNGGSTLNAVGQNFADVIVNTNLAAAAGVIGATIGAYLMFKTADVSQMGNGAIAGLVAITAPCAFVDPWAAVVIGLVAGLIVPPLVVLVDRLRVDDPIGCLPVHGIAGVWGTLAVGLFATAQRTLDPAKEGLFIGGSGHQLWVQFYGVAATVGFTLGLSLAVFALIKYTIGLRVSEKEEIAGLDISEHGMYGYPERFIDVPGATPEEYFELEPVAPAPPRPEVATSSTQGAEAS
jgi:Amt family ammonium transporter